MALSQDLINQFVKLTDRKEKPKEVTVNGTYKMINGEEYVQIDGSEIWTPVTSTVEAETGERVKVMIKNHTATVTGNISSPSARSKSVQDLKDEVDEQGNTIKQLDNTIEQQNNSIIQIDNNIKQVNNDILQANNAINQQGNIIKQLGNEINQQGDVINSMNNDITANSNEITAINNTIVQQNNTIIQHGNTIEQQGNIIKQQGNEINQHGNKIEQFNNEIEQQGNAITQLNNKILQQDNVIQQQGNIIDQQDNIITEHGNNITILNSGFSIIDGVLVGLSQAIIDELKTKHLDAEYATIDFANINMAAVTKLFTESGIIKDLVIQEGHITGELVGVTIKGDLIEGNTIAAEKLVVKGSDGLYYKLNIDGLNNVSTEQSSKFVLLDTKPEDWETNYKDYYLISGNNYVHITDNNIPTWQANTYYKLSSTYESGLDGTNIVAKSITADKVSVTDLVAFGATIGGYNITQHSIYSGGKSSVNNVSRGVYMDDDGQIAFGDNNNFIKFFKDTDNQYKIRIQANEIYTSSGSKSIADQIEELAQDTTEAYNKAQAAQNSATSANNKIDNLEIGGRNYLQNSDFKKTTTISSETSKNPNLYPLYWGGYNSGISNPTTSYHAHIDNDTFGYNVIEFNESDGTRNWKGINIKLNDIIIEYDSYIFSFDAYTTLIGSKIFGGFHYYKKDGTTRNFWSGQFSVNFNSEDNIEKWVRYSVKVPLNDDIDFSKDIAFYVYGYGFTSNAICYINKLKLEKGNKSTDWTSAPEDLEDHIDNIQNNLTNFTDVTFTAYKREQEKTNRKIDTRLTSTEITVYGDENNPEDPSALVNHIQKLENDVNGSNGAMDRIESAEDTIEGTGLNDYDQRIKITQRFLNVETDVEQIKNIFKITGGTNLVQNSVGYFADNNNKPTMWSIAENTIYTPFGYDGDLTGITVSRGRLFCAKGSVSTTSNNIVALLANKMMSISFKYKNGANATSKIKVFNGSTVYFEKTFNTTVNQWTEYTFDPNTDPVLANPTFLNTSNSLQISIESTNSTNNNGFEISDLMLNYGNPKPWELSSNEVYGAMVKLSSLGIEVTATTANTKNFMTTDGILVYRYDSKTDKIIGTEPITKITDDGTVTNKLESTGDIIERNLIQTMIKDSSNNDIYVEYIR